MARSGPADIRPDSPTYRATQVIEMGGENQVGVFIPIGVAHGFVALADATLTYIVDNYYDGADEHGVAWNDPDLALPWGVEALAVSAIGLVSDTHYQDRLFDLPADLRDL